MASSSDTQISWTASRCSRLLRPITSRKSALRTSHPPQESICSQNDMIHFAEPPSRPKDGDSPDPKLDPDWMLKPKKAAPRQYARLPSLSSKFDPKLELSAGSLAINTPMIARIRGVGATKPEPVLVKSKSECRSDIFHNKFVSPADNLNFRSQKLCQGTLSLIEATNDCRNPEEQTAFFPASGARSLRAMCARRYAREIVDLEQEQEDGIAEEKFDVAGEAYKLLEETLGDAGGDYLRAVVREHGVRMFAKFVSSALIPRDHVLSLTRKMSQSQRSRCKNPSTAEVETIASALIQTTTPDRSCCGKNNLWGHTFNKIANVSVQLDQESRIGFEFRQFDNLINSIIPVSWLGSRRMSALWANVFRAFVDSSVSHSERVTAIRDVTRFFGSFVALDCGINRIPQPAVVIMHSNVIPDYHGIHGCQKCPHILPHTSFLGTPNSRPHVGMNNPVTRKRLLLALNNSITSVCGILASFVVTSVLEPQETANLHVEPIVSLLGNLSMDILLREVPARDLSKEYPFESNISILATTLIILLLFHERGYSSSFVAISINDLVGEIEALDRRARKVLNTKTPALEALPELVYSIARGAGKLSRSNSLDILVHVLGSLTQSKPVEAISSATRPFFIELAASSAQLFAERVDSADAQDVAKQFNHLLMSDNRRDALNVACNPTPRPRRDRDGLRWEEGICEWVEETPALPRLKAQSLENRSLRAEFNRANKKEARLLLTGHSAMDEGEEDELDGFETRPRSESVCSMLDEHLESTDEVSDESDNEINIQAVGSSPQIITNRRQASGLSVMMLPFEPVTVTSPVSYDHASPCLQQQDTSTQKGKLIEGDAKIHQTSKVLLREAYGPRIRHSVPKIQNEQLLASSHFESSQLPRATMSSNISNNLKRSFSELRTDEDSDDELSLSHEPSTKRNINRNAKTARKSKAGPAFQNDSEDEISELCQDTLFTTQTRPAAPTRVPAAHRRNPRGTMLRSLSGRLSGSSTLAAETFTNFRDDVWDDELDEEMDNLGLQPPYFRAAGRQMVRAG